MPRSEGLTAEISTVFVDIPGDKVRIQYKKGEYTGKFLVDMALEPNHILLSKLIIEWDLTKSVPVDPKKPDSDKKEVPFPITPDDLAGLPNWFLLACLTRINRDNNPNQGSPGESLTI